MSRKFSSWDRAGDDIRWRDLFAIGCVNAFIAIAFVALTFWHWVLRFASSDRRKNRNQDHRRLPWPRPVASNDSKAESVS